MAIVPISNLVEMTIIAVNQTREYGKDTSKWVAAMTIVSVSLIVDSGNWISNRNSNNQQRGDDDYASDNQLVFGENEIVYRSIERC